MQTRQPHKTDFSKWLFILTVTCTILSAAFLFGLYSGANRTPLYKTVISSIKSIKQSFTVFFEEVPNLTKAFPTHFLEPCLYDGAGVTINRIQNPSDYVFMSGFFDGNNEMRLLRRDGKIITRWTVRFSEIFPDPDHLLHPPATDWNTYIHGACLLPDGSVVFNFEYGGLVKLDRAGNVVWTLPRETHHSLERAEKGGFWVCGRRWITDEQESRFPPFEPPYEEDTILRISEQGAIVKEISIPLCFYENDLIFLLTSSGFDINPGDDWDREILHTNKITELTFDMAKHFPSFEPGDLLISERTYNLIFVVNPETRKIKWYKIGPWLRQHDPEFREDGLIILFNNGLKALYENSIWNDRQMSTIMAIDPLTDRHRILYGHKPGQAFVSWTKGKLDLTRDKGLLITACNTGRVIEVDSGGKIVWEYINRYDSEQTTWVTEAKAYPIDYFSIYEW